MWLDNSHSCCSHSLGTSIDDISFPISIHFKSISIRFLALLDSRATTCFMDEMFLHKPKFSVVRFSKPIPMEVIDGRMLSFGAITEATVPLISQLGEHQEVLTFYVIASPRYPIILGLSWLKEHNPIVDWCNHSIIFPHTSLEVQAVSHVAVTTKKMVHSASVSSSSMKTTTDSLSSKYEEFGDVFEKKNVDRLPEHRPYDCPIDLQEGASPPFGPIYGLSEPELQALRTYLDENLEKGFIQPSKSPTGAPILLVEKERWLLCADYRGLNKITVRNRYPLPLILELLDRLRTGRIFSKIDLRGHTIWYGSNLEMNGKPSLERVTVISSIR